MFEMFKSQKEQGGEQEKKKKEQQEVIKDENGETTKEVLIEQEIERLKKEYPDMEESRIKFIAEYGTNQAIQEVGVLGKIRNKSLKATAMLMATIAIGLSGWGIKKQIGKHIEKQAAIAEKECQKWNEIIASLEIPTDQLSPEQAKAILDARFASIYTWDGEESRWIELPQMKDPELSEKVSEKASEILTIFEVQGVGSSLAEGNRPPTTAKIYYVLGLKKDKPDTETSKANIKAQEELMEQGRAMHREALQKINDKE
ncbi:MAG: hypothetical protein ABIG90_00035 [bacterium]